MLDEVYPQKKFPRSGPGSPTVMKDFSIVLRSSPGKKVPRTDPGSPTHRYEANPHCFEIQPRKKVPPARPRFPHTPLCTEIPLFQHPAPKKSSPGLSKVPPRHVTSHHVTSHHVTSHHATSRHATSRHVTTSTMNCNVPVWGCCTGII